MLLLKLPVTCYLPTINWNPLMQHSFLKPMSDYCTESHWIKLNLCCRSYTHSWRDMYSPHAASPSAVRLASSPSTSNHEPSASQMGSRASKWSTAAFEEEAGKEKQDFLVWSWGEWCRGERGEELWCWELPLRLKDSGGGVEDGAELGGKVESWHKMRTPFTNIWPRAAASLLLLWRQKAR